MSVKLVSIVWEKKIWSNDVGRYQFLIVAGKVRLREEGVGKPLAALEVGIGLVIYKSCLRILKL